MIGFFEHWVCFVYNNVITSDSTSDGMLGVIQSSASTRVI